MEKIFELENVKFSYLGKFPALNNVSLEVSQGERLAILGANGSGKSTLLHMLAGLVYPDSGTARAFGRRLSQDAFADEDFRRHFRSRVALLFQNSEAQLFLPTVEEELYFGPLQLDLPPPEAEKNIETLCLCLGIKDLLGRSPQQLSIGEKKKVAIASILAINPEILLLDEPTAGLDPRTSRQLLDLIIDHHAQGKTVITATHDLHIVADIAEKVYIFGEQKGIVASGSSEGILSNEVLLADYNLAHIHKHKHLDSWHKHSHQHGCPEG